MKIQTYLALLSSLVFLSCNQTPAVVEDTATRLPEEVEQIITTKCAVSGCHNQEHKDELNLSTWGKIFAGSPNVGSVVVPYNHDWSHIFQHVNSFADLGLSLAAEDRMPPAPLPALSKEEVVTLKNWINNGARDAQGNYYWEKQEARMNNKLFVLCSGSDLVAVVDIPTNKVMRYISVGALDNMIESPHYILLSPDKKYFYVTLIAGNLLEKYRTDTYERVGRIVMGASPSLMYLNWTGTRMIVTLWNNDVSTPKVQIVNTESMQIQSYITDDLPLPHGLAVSPNFRYAYVVHNLGNYFTKFTISADGNDIVDAENFPLDPADPVPTGSQKYYPYQAVLLYEQGLLLIACKNSNEVRVYNTANNQLVKVVKVEADPRLMVYDEETNRVFVACANAANTAEQGSMRGCVSVVNAATWEVEKNIYNLGHRPHGIDIDKVNRKLYVSTENTGGVDVPHHPIPGVQYPPGKFVKVDLKTLEVDLKSKMDIAAYPNSLCVLQ